MNEPSQLQLGADLGPRVDLLETDTCQEKWQVEPGEFFLLRGATGVEHRLVCGDSRNIRLVLAVLEGLATAGFVWVTDPFYGIKYSQATQPARKGQGGHALPTRRKDRDFDGRADRFDTSWMPIWGQLAPPSVIYLFTSWKVLERWRQAMTDAGWPPQARLAWDKLHFGMGDVSRYGNQLEDILNWYEKGRAPRWEKREGNVWHEAAGVCIDGSGGQVGHPTQKPIALYQRAIEHGAAPDDVVIDMFGGSGTAILAADGQRRRSVVVEIAPRYVALALERCARAGIAVAERSLLTAA